MSPAARRRLLHNFHAEVAARFYGYATNAQVDYETSDGWEDETPPILCMECDEPTELDDCSDLPRRKKHRSLSQ